MAGKRGLDGQVTVFVSMILMILFAFLCVLLESARTAGARWYLQMAASSAMDSVFSQYHRELWEKYRLLFAEYETGEEIEADFSGFLTPYLETDNWYPMALEQTQAEEIVRVTDGHGKYLEKEILDYMKYGIWNPDFRGDEVEQLWDQDQEAEAVTEMAETYRKRTKDMWKLEKILESISENLESEKNSQNEGLRALSSYDGDGFRRAANQMIRELKKMPGLVEKYEKEADKLAETLASDRKDQEEREDRLSTETADALDEEISEYEAYVAEDGKRRQEVRNLDPWSEETIQTLENLIEESYEVEREIEEWEDDDDDEDGDSEPDYESLWRPVRNGLQSIKIPALSFTHGVKDKETESLLKQVEQLYQEGFLNLLVPEGRTVSKKTVETSSLPSVAEGYDEESGSGGMAEHILINEYCGRFFRQFCTEEAADGQDDDSKQDAEAAQVTLDTGAIQSGQAAGDGQNTASQKEKTSGHALDYEVEYLICGNSSDPDNLSGVVHRLLAVRAGLNLIHILRNKNMREQARMLASVITGVASITPLVLATTFFVMSVWSLGEALMDVKGLLAGKKVKLVKKKDDWTLTIENLITMAKNKKLDSGGGDSGLSYLSWLKILLFVTPAVRQDYRIMDVIELNLAQGKSGFRMRNAVYQVQISGDICGKHLFFSPAIVENLTGNHDNSMMMTVKAERRY